jgi:hypothetical protein
LSAQYDTRILPTTKMIYTEMPFRKTIIPKIEEKVPSENWPNIWHNLALNSLPTDWSSTAYLVMNDVIPSGQKLYRHRISTDQPLCSTCGSLDSTTHRVKYCHGSTNIWLFLTNVLTQRLDLRINDPIELLENKLNNHSEAGLWFTIAAVWYNINKFRTGQLEEFKQEVRVVRWQKRKLLEKFGNSIHIF